MAPLLDFDEPLWHMEEKNLFFHSYLENANELASHFGSRKHGVLDFMIGQGMKIAGTVNENIFGKL